MLHHGHWPIMQVNLCYMASETKKCKTSHIHTRLTALFPGPTTSWYQKRETNLDFTEARDSEWQWHQLGRMRVCNWLQTDNHANTPPLKFFTDRIPFRPQNQQCQSTEGNQCKTSLEQNFTACMPLQKATSSFRLEKYATLLVNCVTY